MPRRGKIGNRKPEREGTKREAKTEEAVEEAVETTGSPGQEERLRSLTRLRKRMPEL